MLYYPLFIHGNLCCWRPFLRNDKRALEAILEPDLRQIAGLEAEIEREQKLLEKEEDYLQELKKNAIAQENIRRQKSRNVCYILLPT